SNSNSIYHGLTVEMNKRYANHFTQRVAFTWSKAIDDVPDATAVVPNGGDDAKYVQNPLNIADDRAASVNDQPKRLVASGTWDIAYADSSAIPAVRSILGGWAVSYILTAQTGQPYT